MSCFELNVKRSVARHAAIAWLALLAGSLMFAGCSGDTGDDDASQSSSPTPSGDDDATHVSSPTPGSSPTPTAVPGADKDDDGVTDDKDNCPNDANSDQKDADNDDKGDKCDTCPNDAKNDQDGDKICGDIDNCPTTANKDQADGDGDGDGDVCDTCNDSDKDTICDEAGDNCPTTANKDQKDTDSDGIGDACDLCADPDGDTICNEQNDNCPTVANKDQKDSDADGLGDACDTCTDEDSDGKCDELGADNCPTVPNADQSDADADGKGDACDECPKDVNNDADADGVCGDADNCPDDANSNQMDRDRDGAGDLCDACPDDDPDYEGCGNPTSTNPKGKFFIYGTYPDDGYQAVSTSANGRVYFSQAYTGDVNKIHVTLVSQYDDQEPINQIVNLISDKTEAYFYLAMTPVTDYCLLVEIEEQAGLDGRWPLRHTACFTTSTPCGVPDNVGQVAVIKKLGGTDQQGLTVLNAALKASSSTGNNYPVVLLMQNILKTSKFPLTFDSALGAFSTDTSGTNTLMKEGYTSTFHDCTIDASSNFKCTGDKAVLPLYADGFGVTIYIDDALVVAKASSSGNITNLTNFDLSGYVTDDNLRRLFAELGPDYEKYYTYIKLDLDINNDGVKDAATFEIVTTPKAMTLANATCPVP